MSLLEELPKIAENGKRKVKKILENLDNNEKLTLQTTEYVLPSKNTNGLFNGVLEEPSKDNF